MDIQSIILSIAGALSAYYFHQLVASVKELNEKVARILERIQIHSEEIGRLRDDVEQVKEKIK